MSIITNIRVDDARALIAMVDYIESLFPHVDFVPGKMPGIAPTGEPYVELTAMEWQPSREAVLDAAKARFVQYARGKTGKLYWRCWPEITQDERGWRYYMRLLISDREWIS